MINWEKTHRVFADPSSCLVSRPTAGNYDGFFPDSDIEEVVSASRKKLAPIFKFLSKCPLKFVKEETRTIDDDTAMTSNPFTVKTFSSKTDKLELWFSKHSDDDGGWA